MSRKIKLSLIIGLFIILVLIPGLIYSQSRKSYILLGFSLGEPTALAGRWQFNPNQGIEVTLGATLLSPFFNEADPPEVYDADKIKFNIGVTYIYNLFLTRKWDLPLFLGAGINFKFESNSITRFGIKLPSIGIEKIFRSNALKWGIYFDVGLITNLTPEEQSVFDWITSLGDSTEDSWYYFYQAFDIHITIGLRFYIPT